MARTEGRPNGEGSVNTSWIARLSAVAGTMLTGIVGAANPTPGQGAGWTGVTSPKAVIEARQELMKHIEVLMEPIDTITVEPAVKPVKDVERLHSNADVIGAMLLAVPHLFPPTTNRYDPATKLPETLALPAIWRDFSSFDALAGVAAKAAASVVGANTSESLRAASLKLRASCDACHALFLRKYEGPKTQDSDAQFDFDAALGNKAGDGK
jgi:cytochrome c556